MRLSLRTRRWLWREHSGSTCMLRQPDRERDRLFSILDAHTGARFYRVPGLFNWLQDDAGRNALALLSRVLWFSISEEVMEAECAALARGGEDGVLIVAHVIADTHVFIGSLAELARAKDKLYKSRADLPRQNQRYYQLKGRLEQGRLVLTAREGCVLTVMDEIATLPVAGSGPHAGAD